MEALRELFKDELEDAYREGRQEDRLEGENCLNALFSGLEQAGRREDIFRAIKDLELLRKIFKEYEME